MVIQVGQVLMVCEVQEACLAKTVNQVHLVFQADEALLVSQALQDQTLMVNKVPQVQRVKMETMVHGELWVKWESRVKRESPFQVIQVPKVKKV